MANIYWVGGTGTWNTSSTTNWASSSGGTGGTGTVPTAADNVFFDSGSGTPGTVTMTGVLTCLSFTTSVTGWTFAAGTSPALTVSGSLSFIAGTTWNVTQGITFNSTAVGNSITTNGADLKGITLNGVGGYWTLGSALTCAGTPGSGLQSGITLTAGTLDTSAGNYALTLSRFLSTGTGVRGLVLNASVVTINVPAQSGSYSGVFWNTAVITNFSFAAGTSSITVNPTNANGATVFNDGGLAFYDLSIGIGANTSGANANLSFNNASTTSFHSLSISMAAANGGYMVIVSNSIAVASAFTFAGFDYANRLSMVSAVSGTVITVTAATAALSYVDFQDFAGAGTATFAGTSIGNGGNVTGVTFTAAKTVYYVGTVNSNWNANRWATASGGSVTLANYPLPQDTAIIDNSSLNTSATLTVNVNSLIGAITFANRTTAITVAGATNIVAYLISSLTLSSAVTVSVPITWAVRSGTAVITSAGVVFSGAVTIDSAGGTVQLADAFTGTKTVTLTSGTINLNNFNLTFSAFSSSNSNTRSILFGSGKFTITGSGSIAWNAATSTNLTTTGTGTISMTAATAKTFAGGGATYAATIDQGGAGTLTITGSNTFGNITASIAPTSAASILFTAGTTTTFTSGFGVVGTAANPITISSATAATHTLSLASGIVISDYLNISYSIATGGATWYAGANSTNSGNNSGWLFGSALGRYWVGGTGTWNTTSTTNWSNSSGGAGGASVPTATDSVFFDSGSGTPGTVTMTGALACKDFIVTAAGWTFASTGTLTVSGSMSLIAGTAWSSTGLLTFNGTAAQTITTASTAFSCGITFNGVGGTWQLQDALTIGSVRTVTLTNGTLNLNNNNITCGLFNSNATGTRTLAFGSGQVYITGNNATILNLSDQTNFTYTGTPNFNLTYSGSTGTRTFTTGAQTGSFSETNVVNIYITAGSDVITTINPNNAKTVNFNGFTGTFTRAAYRFDIYGDLVIGAGMTYTSVANPMYFSATSGTRTITTNAVIINTPITFNGVGGAWQLQDAMTVGSTYAVTLANGTLDLNNKSLTCDTFTSSNSNTRTLAFGAGTISLSGSGTAWACGAATNLTTTGTGTISMTSATAKTFVGGGATYAATLDQGGAGALTITDSNTFANLSKSYASAVTVNFTAGTTTTFTNFSASSTAGNQLTIGSTSAAPATFTSAAAVAAGNYLNLSYITATGAATWYATNSTNGGNNTGWTFSTPSGRYWVGGSGNWNATSGTNWWYTASGPGGAVPPSSTDVANFAAGGGIPATVSIGTNATCLDINVSASGYTFAGNGVLTVNGNLALSAGTAWSANAQLIITGNANVLTNGTVIGSSISINTLGNAVVLQDNLTVSSSQRLTLTNGNLDINGQSLSIGSFQTAATGNANLIFNGGTVIASGSPNAWLNNNPSGFNMLAGSANGIIQTSSASAKTFAGGSEIYPAVLINAGSGTLSITGNNKFVDLQAPVLPATLLFAANSTTTFNSFSATGTAAGTLTIGSINPGISANLSVATGAVNVNYAAIQDSNAQGGATWYAYNSNGNQDLGNNNGWIFAASGLHPVSFGGLTISGGIDLF